MSLTYPTGYFEEGYNLENKFLTRAAREKYQDNINPADYDTELTPNEQQEYNSWVKTMQATGKMAPGDEKYDYDMQGFFKNEVLPQTEVGKSGSAETHFIDTYKNQIIEHFQMSQNIIIKILRNMQETGMHIMKKNKKTLQVRSQLTQIQKIQAY
nr:MAG TPA: hypothetical protein [Caudoviricetes sp.]